MRFISQGITENFFKLLLLICIKVETKTKLKTAPCDLCHNVSSFAKIFKDQRTWRTSLKNCIFILLIMNSFDIPQFPFMCSLFLSIFAFPD